MWRSWACTFGSRAFHSPRIVGLPVIGPEVRPVHNTSNCTVPLSFTRRTKCFQRQAIVPTIHIEGCCPGSDTEFLSIFERGQNVTQAITITMPPLMRHQMCPASFNIKNRFAIAMNFFELLYCIILLYCIPRGPLDGFERQGLLIEYILKDGMRASSQVLFLATVGRS